jgi:hypothetical protein
VYLTPQGDLLQMYIELFRQQGFEVDILNGLGSYAGRSFFFLMSPLQEGHNGHSVCAGTGQGT